MTPYGPHTTVRIGCIRCHGRPRQQQGGNTGLYCPRCETWVRKVLVVPDCDTPDGPRLRKHWRRDLANHERLLRGEPAVYG